MANISISIERYDELLKKEAIVETLTRIYKTSDYVSINVAMNIIGETEGENK